MDITWKRAENYRNMARQGVTCGTLRQDWKFAEGSWTLQCWKDKELPDHKAKAIVSEYLRSEFEATGITFFRVQGQPANKFIVRFYSFAL